MYIFLNRLVGFAADRLKIFSPQGSGFACRKACSKNTHIIALLLVCANRFTVFRDQFTDCLT